MRPLSLLFVHQNFPGQFGHIVAEALARGHRVHAIGGPTARPMDGVAFRRWRNSRSTTSGIFETAVRAEADLIRAQAAALTAEELRREGFSPDVIIGHPGWGETLHLRKIFPQSRQVLLGEYFYSSDAAELGFDPEVGINDLQAGMRATAKNMGQALAYTMADRIVCPTPFQASTFPDVLRPLIQVHHEGVDLRRASKDPQAVVRLDNGAELRPGDPVITFVNRAFEPMRGFHVFMRALPQVLAQCPDAQVLLIGADSPPFYGPAAAGGSSWKAHILAELGSALDMERVHFLGTVPHDRFLQALSVSRAHVYYTYPFVLSWSLIEAMGCECLILGSDTAPVRDAISHGREGLLHDFLDVPALSAALIRAIREPEAFDALRRQARKTALERFDRERTGVPGWMKIISEVLERA